MTPLDDWRAGLRLLHTRPISYDPIFDVELTKSARDAGWIEVISPVEDGYGPWPAGEPHLDWDGRDETRHQVTGADAHLDWGRQYVHPDYDRVGLAVQQIAYSIQLLRVGQWRHGPAVLVVDTRRLTSPHRQEGWPEVESRLHSQSDGQLRCWPGPDDDSQCWRRQFGLPLLA
jgi:hypothetical protein